MTIKERMAQAIKTGSECSDCRGKIRISAEDFPAQTAGAPSRATQFATMLEDAKEAALLKCGGCNVAVDGSYDPDTLEGEIACKGSDASSMVNEGPLA